MFSGIEFFLSVGLMGDGTEAEKYVVVVKGTDSFIRRGKGREMEKFAILYSLEFWISELPVNLSQAILKQN